MKTKLCLFLLYVFFVINIVWGQASDITWPHWLTADTWEKWSHEIKFGYIAGLLHGDILGPRHIVKIIQEDKLLTEDKIKLILLKNSKDSVAICCSKVRWEQMVDGIDEFYKDYANKDIPVFMLMPLVCKRVKGEISQESIEKELQKLRAESLKWK